MMLKYLYTISINGGKTHTKEVRQRLSNSVEITGLIQISQHEAKYRVLLQNVFGSAVFHLTPLVPLLGEFSVEGKCFEKVGISL